MNYNETIEQLTGGKGIGTLQSMIGANNFTYDESEEALRFQFKGSRKANMVRIILNSKDLYDVEFYQFSKKTLDVKAKGVFNDVYNDELQRTFEDYTGLRTSL